MVTRVYFSSSVASPIGTIAASANWEQTAATAWASRALQIAKANSALSDVSDTSFPTATTGQTAFRQFCSPQLNVDQTISGTIDIVVRGNEGAASANAYLAFGARVVSADGSTVRGVLKFQGTNSGGTEFGTANQTRIWSAVALSSVNALAGDRILIEVGFHGQSPAAGATGLLRFGDPTGTADFALTSGLTTDLVPWAEFSQTLTFGTPNSLAPTPAVSTTAVPSPAASGSLDLAATPAVATVSVPSPTLDLVSGEIDLAATPALATTAVPSPALSASLDLAATPAAATTSVPSPVASSAGIDLAATPAAATTAVPSPVASSSGIDLAAEPAVATVSVPSPAASGSLGLAAEPALVLVSVPIPLSSSGIDLAAEPAVATTAVPSPVASSSGIDLAAEPAVATVAAPSPVASGLLDLAAAAAIVLLVVPPPALAFPGPDLVLIPDPAVATVSVPDPVLTMVFSSPPTRSLDSARGARRISLDRWPPRTGLGT